MKLYAWLLAQCYDLAMRKTERLCLKDWRRELLTRAEGTLLEIGAGTGANLPHYPAGPELILCEPDHFMRTRLRKKASAAGLPEAQLCDWSAEKLEQPDHSVDTIVSTLVLCSVQNLQHALQEIHRVLKPGGQLLFIEHVRSDCSIIARRQRQYEPIWRCVSGNCHLTRNTVDQIAASGMVIEQLQEDQLCNAPAFVSRTLRGCARKPSTTEK